jgi:hypothetical protein
MDTSSVLGQTSAGKSLQTPDCDAQVLSIAIASSVRNHALGNIAGEINIKHNSMNSRRSTETCASATGSFVQCFAAMNEACSIYMYNRFRAQS